MPHLFLRYIALTLALGLTAFSADTKEDKSKPTAVDVKLSLDKTEPPILVNFAFSVELPRYCIVDGLDTETPPKVKSARMPCPARSEEVGPNLDDLVTALAKDTAYVPQRGDGTHLLFFCATKSCDGRKIEEEKKRVNAAVLSLVKPSPRYYEDEVVPSKVAAADLADAVEEISQGSAKGRLVRAGYVRLETDTKLTPLNVSELRDQIASATPARLKALAPLPSPFGGQRILLPFFCIATTLDGPAPTILNKGAAACDPTTRKARGANAADIAPALTSDRINVKADSAESVIVSCGGSKCDNDSLKLIATSVTSMARPRPAYVEDLTILPGTADRSAAKIVKWSGGSISVDVLSDQTIRLKSDVEILRSEVQAFQNRLLDEGFGEPAVFPTRQMFYQDAQTVVGSLANSPPLPAPLAPGVTPPDTSGLSAAAAPSSSASSGSSVAAAAPTASATPAPAAATSSTQTPSTYATGMVPVGDTIIFTDGPSVTDDERRRLLALLDLPRPEVLMNVWSLQESSPNGTDLAERSQAVRSLVGIHNEALQNAIEYGWAYLSREMQNPQYFDSDFASYLTKRFVSDLPGCAADSKGIDCIKADDREKWGLCPEASYCLGYTQAFKPLQPTLTNILLGLMAAKDPFPAVFTAIGCMEGKYEVYGSTCFPERNAIASLPQIDREQSPGDDLPTDSRQCLSEVRRRYIGNHVKANVEPSCEDLDRAALEAQRQCHVPTSLPLSCFTVQAAKSFVPYHGFSTFTTRQLNGLAEERIADAAGKLPPNESGLSTSPLGLLRSATANFLFNYKMAQEFPKDFSPYRLSHSAQELNAEFNPLVVAFNQDVAAFSRDVMQSVEADLHNSHWYTAPWNARNRNFIADGLVTVRGISGIESLVDTETQSAFNAPQYQTLPSALANLAGLAGGQQPAASGSTTTDSSQTVNGATTTSTSTTAPTPAAPPPPASSNLLSILPGGLARASLPLALAAAVSPTPAQAMIGRQLTVDLTPHALPGASSTELDVKLWAQEDSPPTLYNDGGTSTQRDAISRVARHNVLTRIRIESVKLFEVSSFSALIQRPRTKFPLIPPFVEIPGISNLLGLPLPGAKVYYRSSAIVSAIIVPTAMDLAFGLEFASDRAVVRVGDAVTFRRIAAMNQLPWQQRKLDQFNEARTNCFATRSQFALTAAAVGPDCSNLTFFSLPPDR